MPRSQHIHHPAAAPPPPPSSHTPDYYYYSRSHSYSAHNYSYYTHDPSVPAALLLLLLSVGSIVVYHALHALLRLPSLLSLLLTMVGAVAGPGAREMLAGMFMGGVAERVRERAASFVGGSFFVGGCGGGQEEGFVGGLWNLGNTCYQNSVLQALASLTHLKPHLSTLSTDPDTPSSALITLMATLNTLTPTPRASTPAAVIVRGTDNAWVYNEQQDAQEFFQKLTGSLEREVNRLLEQRRRSATMGLEAAVVPQSARRVWGYEDEEGELSVVGVGLRSPFEGLVAQRVGCLRCGYVDSISMQPFTSLSLSLPDAWTCTLESCLTEFTALEHIPNVTCEKCTLHHHHPQHPALDNDDFSAALRLPKIATTKTKQVMLARPPPVLVLHLNRSQYDIELGVAGKNYASVRFPAWLDLETLGVVTRHDVDAGSWGLGVDPGRGMSGVRVCGQGGEAGGGGGDGDGGGEGKREGEWEEKREGKRNKGYELRSVVAHYGGHHNGHYICYRKYDRRWFRISDHEVFACEERDALAAGNAFMLFYERVQTAWDDSTAEELVKEVRIEGDIKNTMDATVEEEQQDEEQQQDEMVPGTVWKLEGEGLRCRKVFMQGGTEAVVGACGGGGQA